MAQAGTSSSSTNSSAHQRSSSSSRADYTDDQLEAVKRVRKCKDYYEVLGVAKDATDSDLKKAYRKLALALHPDKNKAPGATEAFKAVGNAFAVLSNPQKRKDYDLYGSEEQQQEILRQRRQQARGFYDDDGHYYDYSRGFEGEFTPEEIFNMFFGGAFPSGGVYRANRRYHNRNHAHHAQQEVPGYTVLFQMAPVLVLLGLSLMSSFFTSEPAYSLARTSKYAFERKTTNLEIPYFVKENFEKDYKGSIARIEAQVEEDYLTSLRGQCFRERNYKESMIWRAKSFRDRDLEEKAKNIKTPSCDHLADLSKQYVIW